MPTQVFLLHQRETMLDSVGLLVTTEFPKFKVPGPQFILVFVPETFLLFSVPSSAPVTPVSQGEIG